MAVEPKGEERRPAWREFVAEAGEGLSELGLRNAIIVAGNPASPDVTQLTSPKVSPGRSGSFDAGVSPSLLTSRHDPFAITNNAPPSAFSGSPCFATATPGFTCESTA